MYKIIADGTGLRMSIFNSETGGFIPFDPANSDFRKFKVDVANGSELQSPDGTPMTTKEAQDFLKTLP